MFRSILFSQPRAMESPGKQPDCFRDLNLDQILEPILEQEKNTDLSGVFHTPLTSTDQIFFRQAILRDLMETGTAALWDSLSKEICQLEKYRQKAAEDLASGDPWRCHYLLYGHILDLSERYVRCIESFRQALSGVALRAEGLIHGLEDLDQLRDSPFYQKLRVRQQDLRQKFDREEYCMLIRYGTVRVKKYEGEANLSQEILSVFRKFRQEDGKDYRQELKEEPYADHIEAAILQCLSRIYPELFRELTDYVREFSDFMDPGLLKFCRELRFYIGWLDRIRDLREHGASFCFPEFSEDQVCCLGMFDLALGLKIGSRVVPNDFCLAPGQRIAVVTGPNQGGKTTFARAFGQICYLAALGLCVPGRSAKLPLRDKVLTHFQGEEAEDSGRLQDDLLRLRGLLDDATDRSLLIVNEIFASTTARDASLLGKQMVTKIQSRGAMAVIVTFLSELARLGPEVVSLMSTVDPQDPALRTFRVVPKPPDDLTYASTLAYARGLTYDQLKRRIQP